MRIVAELLEDPKRLTVIVAVTAGDPDLATTGELVAAAARGGADAVMLDVPYSDPLAADEVTYRSLRRALAGETTLESVLDAAAEIVAAADVPVMLSSYAGPLVASGVEVVADRLVAAGVAGVMLVDVPAEEMRWFVPLVSAGLPLFHTVSPTADKERLRLVARSGPGCLCVVSDEPEAALSLRTVRKAVRSPVVVAAPFSTAGGAAAAAGGADGVLALSTVPEAVEQNASGAPLLDEVERRVRALVEACRR